MTKDDVAERLRAISTQMYKGPHSEPYQIAKALRSLAADIIGKGGYLDNYQWEE